MPWTFLSSIHERAAPNCTVTDIGITVTPETRGISRTTLHQYHTRSGRGHGSRAPSKALYTGGVGCLGMLSARCRVQSANHSG